jgi:hypothetical protein
LTRFSRTQRWLANIFPESQSPRTSWPSQVSDDISLVNLWMSGYEQQPNTFYHENVGMAAGASGIGNVLVVDDNHIARILALSVEVDVGAIPTTCMFDLTDVAGNSVVITPHITGVIGQRVGADWISTPVIPPGFTLRARYAGGNGTSSLDFRAMCVVADLGTSFVP